MTCFFKINVDVAIATKHNAANKRNWELVMGLSRLPKFVGWVMCYILLGLKFRLTKSAITGTPLICNDDCIEEKRGLFEIDCRITSLAFAMCITHQNKCFKEFFTNKNSNNLSNNVSRSPILNDLIWYVVLYLIV